MKNDKLLLKLHFIGKETECIEFYPCEFNVNDIDKFIDEVSSGKKHWVNLQGYHINVHALSYFTVSYYDGEEECSYEEYKEFKR